MFPFGFLASLIKNLETDFLLIRKLKGNFIPVWEKNNRTGRMLCQEGDGKIHTFGIRKGGLEKQRESQMSGKACLGF